MKKLPVQLAAAALLAVPLMTARADLVLTQLVVNTGQGFGNVQTIFTLQVTGGNSTTPPGTGNEWGCVAFQSGTPGFQKGAFSSTDNNFSGTTVNAGNYCLEGGANQVANGSPKNALPSLSDAGITNVSEIGLLLNNNQISTDGITINDLVLSFYTPGGDVIYSATLPDGWCNIAALCSGTDTFLHTEQGQGGDGFIFLLTSAQQAALLTAINNSGVPLGNILLGSAANLGCSGTAGANCRPANDGAESLSLVRVNAQTIVPEPGTTALAATGLIGLFGFARRRRNK